ncbi:MAG TPA: hypothetical protein V6D17_05080 [Candidatus Obscuribacterales bacterium]
MQSLKSQSRFFTFDRLQDSTNAIKALPLLPSIFLSVFYAAAIMSIGIWFGNSIVDGRLSADEALNLSRIGAATCILTVPAVCLLYKHSMRLAFAVSCTVLLLMSTLAALVA